MLMTESVILEAVGPHGLNVHFLSNQSTNCKAVGGMLQFDEE